MGHYYQGMTHYEYTTKFLKPHLTKMRKTLDVCGWDPLVAIHKVYEEAQTNNRQKTDDVLFSGSVHAMFHLIVERGLGSEFTSYSRAVHEGEILKLISRLMDFMGHGPTMNEVLMAYHMHAQEKVNGPTYEVTGSLVRQLCDTEIKGVYADEIRLPFPSVYIDLPPSEDFVVFNPDTGTHPVCGIYVTEDKSADVTSLRAYVVGVPKGDIEGLPDDATLYYNLKLEPGILADEAFDRAEKLAKETNVLQHVEGAKWRDIYSWILNVVLYITWSSPGESWMANKEARQLWARIQKAPKGSKKRKALNDRFQKLDPQHRIVLGRGIKYERPAEHKPGRKIASTFRVSGHWKRQRYGKGRQEEKRIFIEPYWKGSGDTALKPKTYNVK